MLNIYDESKLIDAHDYSIIGIAKYKKLKKDYFNQSVTSDDFIDSKKYFIKSKKLNNKIIENDYYLYLLNLFEINTSILNKTKDDFYDYEKIQKNFDESINGYSDVISLINNFYNRNLKKFLFVDSLPTFYFSNINNIEFGLISGENSYNILKFLQNKGIITDFNNRILSLLKISNPQNRYYIIGSMLKEMKFSDIGQDIINFIENNLEIEKNPIIYDNTNEFIYTGSFDQDLKEKLSYLLGCFGDKRAENVLISFIDNNNPTIKTAFDALSKINSVKSLPILINLYNNVKDDYNNRYPARYAIMDIISKNNFSTLKKIFLVPDNYKSKH